MVVIINKCAAETLHALHLPEKASAMQFSQGENSAGADTVGELEEGGKKVKMVIGKTERHCFFVPKVQPRQETLPVNGSFNKDRSSMLILLHSVFSTRVLLSELG